MSAPWGGLIKAVDKDGAEVRGYAVWECIDPVSSITGSMRNRYGFVCADKKDGGVYKRWTAYTGVGR